MTGPDGAPPPASRSWRDAGGVLAIYTVLTIALTWPLVLHPGRDVAWDLGDSLLNMWILAWDAEQFRAIAAGDFSRIARFFDANIFHPTPLTLAYSEHLIPQALQVFPLYLITRNPILCYNLLFLSTFVLSAFGMYLLVRDLTGSRAAAFIAGLIFAFAPYRWPQFSHLQVLSSQWMPFVLFGLHRYFDTGRVRALVGALAALVVQGLSSGYYLLFFTPFAVAFALWEMGRRERWRSGKTWLQLSAAAILAGAVVLPFLLPYAAIRTQTEAARLLPEVVRFSADVYSYVTPFTEQRVWGPALQGFPKPEGELFPGAIPVLLAAAGIFLWRRDAATAVPAASPRMAWLTRVLFALMALHLLAAGVTLVDRRVSLDLGLFTLQMSNVTQLLVRAAVLFAVLLGVSRAARARTVAFMRTHGFFALALVAAVWLSLGPSPRSFGVPVNVAAPYGWFYEHVPGFDGVRVPARLAMVVVLMLAILSGFGVAAIAGRTRRAVIVTVLGALFLFEAAAPFGVNGVTPIPGVPVPEGRVFPPAEAPAVYRALAREPADAVLVELPLGVTDYDLRAVYYTTAHWRPVLNGYSGFFPTDYGVLAAALADLGARPAAALTAIRERGATHAIVHEAAFNGDEGARAAATLRMLGAVELFRDGTDVLFLLPR